MPEISNNVVEMEAINSIPEKDVKTPVIPMADYLQECEDLNKWAQPDKEKLLERGMEVTLLDSLPTRTAICRDAQAKWSVEQKSISDAKEIWKTKSPLAKQLEDQLMADFRYAFRGEDNLLKSVANIADKVSNAQLIQNLSDLAALGNANLPLLAKTNFDTTKLAAATNYAAELAPVLAQVNEEKNMKNPFLVGRNRAYTYLKIAVDEIRDCGKYVFRDNEARAKGYYSEYNHKAYQKRKSKNDEDADDDKTKD